jgi:integrase
MTFNGCRMFSIRRFNHEGGCLMASIGNDPNGYRRILFVAPDGSRKTIRLGKCSSKIAESVKHRVESLLSACIVGTMDRDTSIWLAEITTKNPDLRSKLEAVRLVEPTKPEPIKPTLLLSKFLEDFLERHRATKKPSTIVVWGQVVRMLNQYMPDGIALEDVTVGHAKDFLAKLQARVKKGELSSTTVHKRVSFARQFFQDATDWELIPSNPFNAKALKTVGTSKKSNVDVPLEVIRSILLHCDATWNAIVCLSRFGGLRCPSETLSLKWGDVDFENGKLAVPEPKVEHHEGRGVRSCPLFPELRKSLEALSNETTEQLGHYPTSDSFVIDKPAYRASANENGWANANLRTQFLKILRRAGVTPWARLFHSMRATRQTELVRSFPLHVVCSWLGNSESVAKKNYLLVRDEDFAKAIEQCGTDCGTVNRKSGTECGTVTSRNEQQLNEESLGNPREKSVFPDKSKAFLMEVKGLEPMTSCMPCKRSPN